MAIKENIFIIIVLILGWFFPFDALAVDIIYDDLYAKTITVQPESPRVGEKTIITIDVRNSGNKNIYTTQGVHSFSYDFPGFNLKKADYTTPSFDNYIAPREYMYYTLEGEFNDSGDKIISFTVDADEELEEGYSTYEETLEGEENNTISKEISVGAISDIDLSIDSIEFDPEDFLIGENVDVIINIKNESGSSLTSGLGLTENIFGHCFIILA